MKKTIISGSEIASGTISNTQLGLASTAISSVTTAVTTTSTTAYTTVNSISFTPSKTGQLLVMAFLVVNNDTAGDGVSAQITINGMAYGTTTLISSAANQNQVYAYSTIYNGYVGMAVSINTEIEAVTGGTASAVGNLIVMELLA
jgi:hypothetical protein